MDYQVHLNEFDAVVLGTGISESILAAAIARSGRSVLHLERAECYGDAWSTLDLEELIAAVEKEEVGGQEAASNTASQTTLPFADRTLASRVGPGEVFGDADGVHKTLVDLSPRPIFCSGDMVDLLVRSKGGNYVDFKPLTKTFLDFGEGDLGLQQVPASRSEVFQTRIISPVDKRVLMRFIKDCSEGLVVTDEKTFVELMQARHLSDRLQKIMLHTVLFAAEGPNTGDPWEGLSAGDGVEAVRRFSSSLARFNTNSAILFTNYGSGELPQAFCRLAAVQGAVYILRRGLQAVTVKDGAVKGVTTTAGDNIATEKVFASSMYDRTRRGEEEFRWRFCGLIHHGAENLLSDVPRALVLLPSDRSAENSAVRMWQMDSTLGVCQQDRHVLYAECLSAERGNESIRAAFRRVLGDEWRSLIVRGVLYRHRLWRRAENGSKPAGLSWVYDQDIEIDYHRAIKEAERVFCDSYPGETMFPPDRPSNTSHQETEAETIGTPQEPRPDTNDTDEDKETSAES